MKFHTQSKLRLRTLFENWSNTEIWKKICFHEFVWIQNQRCFTQKNVRQFNWSWRRIAILCYIMLSCALLCCTLLCCAVLCWAVLFYALLHYVTLRFAMLCYFKLSYLTLRYSVLRYALLCSWQRARKIKRLTFKEFWKICNLIMKSKE